MTLGQVAYEAYATETAWRTFDDRQMPSWDDLGERIQRAWEAAAQAVDPFRQLALSIAKISKSVQAAEPGHDSARDQA